jgi:transcription antitermination protein NusB
MLNRRHIRIKVLQNLYAIQKTQTDAIDVQEKFLMASMENMKDLYLMMISTLIEIQKTEQEYLEVASQKHLATYEERNPNKKFINNAVLQILVNSDSLGNNIEEAGVDYFKVHNNYISHLIKEIKNSDIYAKYMSKKEQSFKEDQEFVVAIYREIIAPDEKIYAFIEDSKITWLDDVPVVNTTIVKQLSSLKHENDYFRISKVFKDEDDKEFAKQLFRKTILNFTELAKTYQDKTNNWEVDRIAEVDAILLNMGVCELQKFPSIPVKVTINEYLEIAKEYSTAKSSIFINGILDVLVKEMKENQTLNKIGRGLIE